MTAHHPIWNGPRNEHGQPHGTSITRYGTEHMVNGMLHDRGDEPAQVTILPAGEIEYSHYKMDIRVGEHRITRNGTTVFRERWSLGMRDGPAMRLESDGTLVTQTFSLGRLHGISTATDPEGNIAVTNFVCGRPVSTSYYARSNQAPLELVLECGSLPVPLGAAAGLVELSDSEAADSVTDSSDAPVIPASPVAPPPPPPLAQPAFANIPRSRVVRREQRRVQREEPVQRPQRVRKVPARYRSSQY